MKHQYLSGISQPDHTISVPHGRAVGGSAIGILVVDAWYPMLPGNVANACSYDFPVLYKILKKASIEKIMCGDPSMLEVVIEGGRELVEQGARAVVGACGSFANYQKKTAAALDVPTFLSVMLQAPLILKSLKPDQKLGVIAASKAALTPKVFKECDINDPSRMVITEVINLPEFKVLAKCEGCFNSGRLEGEIIGLVKQFRSAHPEVGALLLQCSDLPPYAHAMQNAIHLPVFDMNTMINWIYNAVVQKPYHGIV